VRIECNPVHKVLKMPSILEIYLTIILQQVIATGCLFWTTSKFISYEGFFIFQDFPGP